MNRAIMLAIFAFLFVASIPFVVIGLSGCSNKTDDMHSLTEPSLSSTTLAKESTDSEGDDAMHTYDVTIDNLTTGQPLSPGVVVTHTKRVHVWELGERASEGIRLIAEDGDPSVAKSELAGQPGVHEVVATTKPIHRLGGPGSTSLTVRISAKDNENRLSVAVMLICTNDGFTGLDGVKLPGGSKAKVFYASAYDAGTEANDELSTSIVDPCGAIGPVPMPPDGNNRTATSDVITYHPGIQGGHSLDPALHGWQNPVARITVQRVK